MLAFMGFPKDDRKKIASTNPLERVNKEIKRRSNVGPYPRPVSFPSDAAIMRIAGALIVEQDEEWHLTHRYMSNESLAEVI